MKPKDDEKQRAIAQATFELVAQTGLSGLTMADINDTLEAQLALFQRLFATGVLPYYLHLLDKVQGAAHFDVPEHHARMLLEGLKARLPGYMVPRLVREVEGATSKVGL